jgi:hypothetical protein
MTWRPGDLDKLNSKPPAGDEILDGLISSVVYLPRRLPRGPFLPQLATAARMESLDLSSPFAPLFPFAPKGTSPAAASINGLAIMALHGRARDFGAACVTSPAMLCKVDGL